MVGVIVCGRARDGRGGQGSVGLVGTRNRRTSAANFQNMTMGMGFLPMPGMFGSPTPSATDAAALGMTGGPRGGMMGMGGTTMGNPFMNPMASPFLYGSMFPMTQQQAGVMMLAGQAQMLGIGSGQLSGVRPGGIAAGGVRGRQTQTVGGASRYDPSAWRAGGSLLQPHVAEAAHPARLLQPAESALSASWRDKNILRGFDLSERAIVPIVSLVKTDPALFGSAARAEANLTVNSLPFAMGPASGNCLRVLRGRSSPVGGLFGRCRNAGRKRCMDTARIVYRRAGWLALLAFFAACGCQTVKTPEEKIANSNIPNEFKKVSMPDYVVEPPDLILVEVLEGLPGRPISGERLVRPDGKISLGLYGDVYVAGLTVPEVKEKIVLHLRKYLHDEVLGLIKVDDETGDSDHRTTNGEPRPDRTPGLGPGVRRRNSLQ